MATQNGLQQIVSLVSDQELEVLALNGRNYASNHPDMTEEEQCLWQWVMATLAAEAQRRKVEPPWRKARRFALHNSVTLQLVGTTAAVVTIGGIVLGPWLGFAAGVVYLTEQQLQRNRQEWISESDKVVRKKATTMF